MFSYVNQCPQCTVGKEATPSCATVGLLFFTDTVTCFTGLLCKMDTVMQQHPIA